MSSGTQTRCQLVSRYDRLKRRVETVKLPDGLLKDIVEAEKATLDMFPISATQPSTTVAMPSAEVVESFIKDLLPSPADVLTESFYRAPLFAFASLYEVAEFYECFPGLEAVMESLGFTAEDCANKSVKIHVWFADLLGCNTETILAAIDMYKSFRGSPDMLRRLSPPSRVASIQRGEPASPSERHNGSSQREVINAPGRDPASHTNLRVREDPPRSRGEERDQHPPIPSRTTPEIEVQDRNDSRKATNVFQYFKDSKFSGEITQSIELTIRDYNVCARQHNLTAKQKADFFVNVLADPGRTFFFNNANDDMTFEDMACMMVREYNSNARQLQVQGSLDTLRLDKFMTEHQLTSNSEGLTKIVDLIERLTPQCQQQFRSDANKISYLRKAVLGFHWAMVPIGNIITAKYSFNAFVTALREHLQLENEVSLSNSSAAGSLKETINGTFHQRYGRHPRHVRKHVPPGKHPRQDNRPSSSPSFEDSRREGICHRCRQNWRPGHRCQAGAIRGYVRNRLKNGDSAIHIVSDLVLGLEGDAEEPGDEDDSHSSEQDESNEETHYGEPRDELSLFDEMTAGGEAEPTGFVEMNAKEWYDNHLSASFTGKEEGHPSSPSQDF